MPAFFFFSVRPSFYLPEAFWSLQSERDADTEVGKALVMVPLPPSPWTPINLNVTQEKKKKRILLSFKNGKTDLEKLSIFQF